ncbi:MAG: DNA gyrase subunit A [Cytophagales bacterium]|nr:MAG: DNA gyrase subunit A [Cytophagales bacterium]
MADITDNLDLPTENIIPISIEDEMRTAYIDYSMSVIVSRALPDVRDGLKPVHRRILYAADELGLNYNKPYKKSARLVGEVLGKYHPHGDSSVYDAIVRMAQHWSLRYPLIDGQGNFGSVDGDPPAAMRYTEIRMTRIAEELLKDLNKDTVNWQSNFDDSLEEPTVLPGGFPNLLVNGTSGIAVGMATNMAPHNLSEVIDGTLAYMDNYDIEITELMKYIKAPDFPTGAQIYGYSTIRNMYETGRGRIVMRSDARIENNNSKDQIIVTSIPYQVNKAELIKKVAELVNDKVIEGITGVRDESDKEGYRVVFDLRRDCIPNVVLNNLFKHTQLQTSFSVNNVGLVHGRPMTLSLKDLIRYFVEHRHEIVTRRTQFELAEAKRRAHLLEGYMKILGKNDKGENAVDEVIKIIKDAREPEIARVNLMARFELSDIQSRAILDLQLRRLTGLEIEKIEKEYNEIMALIADLQDILDKESRRMDIIKAELIQIKERFGDARRTTIVYAADDISVEDLIEDEQVVITISHEGYIKRTQLIEFKTQNRGGTGSRGAKTKESDFTEHLFVANTHSYLFIFTDKGRLFWMKVYEIPEGAKATKGRPVQNLINIEADDKVRAVININNLKDEEYINNNYLIMATEQGTIKKTLLEEYSRPRQNGINAINIQDGDRLLDVKLTNGNCEIILALRSGRAIRFHESKVRAVGRNSIGVKGVTLDDEMPDDKVVGLVTLPDPKAATLLVVSEKGYGKRTHLVDPEDGEDVYRVTNRGGKGVKTLNVTEKTGKLVALMDVNDTDDLMIINKTGITIRMSVANLRVIGRVSQGVRLIKLNDTDEISSIAKIEKMEGDDEVVLEEGAEGIVNIEGVLGDDAETLPDTEVSEEPEVE